MDATGILADIITDTNFSQLPSDAVEKAKFSIIDTLACILVGSAESEGRIIAEFVKEMGGNPQSSVLGRDGYKTSAPQAALANGTMAHALDYDDTYSTISYVASKSQSRSSDKGDTGISVGHMGGCLLPCVLALGETVGASGKDLITAYVLGFETACRLCRMMGWTHYVKGYHSTSTLGCMGATAAGAKLLNLDKMQTRMALGIAASHASGLRGNFGTMAKPLQSGNAARIGVVSALLASKGFTANKDIIDTDLGYIDVLSMGGSLDINTLTEKAEGGFYIMKGNSLKFLPCANALQSSLETMLELARNHSIAADEVESIEETIAMPRYIVCTKDGVNYTLPKTGLEGKFVLPYGLAAALFDRKITLGTFTDEMVQRPDVQKLFGKTSLILDTSIEQEYLTVRLKDGTEYNKNIGMSKGHWSQSLPVDMLDEKYRDCAGKALSPEAVEHSLELAKHLEDLSNICDLTGIAKG